jgi:hypothetical protein
VQHQRTETPPFYRNYRAYKADLRKEFGGRCVYCRASDAISGVQGFGVDHYRPKRRFATLATEYLNLYYSCNRCNSNKGQFWPTPQQQKAKVFVPNPCEHVMADHMRFHGSAVAHRSNAGEFTVELLDLNEPDVVKLRDAIIRAVALMDERIRALRHTIRQIAKIAKKASNAAEKASLTKALAKAQQNLLKIKTARARFA